MKKQLFFTFTVLLVLGVYACELQAALVLDQEQNSYDLDGYRPSSGYKVGQSFTTSITGTLEQIDMGFLRSIDGDGTVEIFSGEGNQGPLLQTLAVQIYSEDNGQVNYNSFIVNVPVESGRQYSFYFEPNDLTMPDPYYLPFGYPDPYELGVLLVVQNGDTWHNDEIDMVFRTWVETVPEPATTYYVDALNGDDDNDGSSPETAFATIQKGIDSANDGDTVIAAPGTYTGDGNRDIDFLGKAITVRSESGPENCIIDCNGSRDDYHRGFYFHNDEDAGSVVAGLTITKGYDEQGSGILCEQGSPTITDCIISDNVSWGRGGGSAISIFQSICLINNCTISGNSGRGMENSDSSPTLTNCTFSGNSGSGMYNRESNPTLTNCIFSGNSGGGMWNSESSPTVTNCIFSGNSAERDGGGMYNRESDPTLINCTFSGNSADDRGGGMYNSNSSPTLTSCAFIGNSADENGGGVCNLNRNNSNLRLTNCTFSGNSASNGNALACDSWRQLYPSNVQMTNCILWDGGSEIWNNDGSNIIITYSDVQGSWPGEGNINADPDFAFPENYYIMPTSPCIDAGTNTPIGGLPSTDIDGNPRPLDGNGDGNNVVDMGAYEHNPNSPAIAISASAISFSFVLDWSEPDPQTLLIRNCGVGTLNWEIVEDCNWLQALPTNGVSTGQINEVTLTVDPNGLAIGGYSCILRIIDSSAINSPVTVRVTLRVGEILRVPDDFFTIQAAIDAAYDYDIVLVADDTYTGDGNRDIDFLGKAITVRSENGPENCIIDCNGTETEYHHGFYFHNYESTDSILEGFTITNGYDRRGSGGIRCEQSSPTITDCIISGNVNSWGRSGGGAISIFQSISIINNCVITGNNAMLGAGISCRYSSPTITNCTISGNSAKYKGGGMYNDWSSPTLTNCTFSGNQAGEEGGGMYNEWESSPTLTNCTFSGNSAEYYGGGIRTAGWSTLTNCILWENTPEQISGRDSAAVTYSDVQGGWPGEGNIDADPCFVGPGYWDVNCQPDDEYDDICDYFWIEGDYHLQLTSPCIDAANDAGVYTDIEDNIRPFDFPGVDNNGELPEFDMGAYEAMVSCFGVNYVKLETKAGKKGNKVELKGTFSPALPIDFARDDVIYIIDDGQGHMLSFIIPAGSFEPDGEPEKQKFKFDSPKHSQPDIKAKFDFDKCKFELKAKRVQGTNEITGETLAIVLQAGENPANLVEEVVQMQVKPKHIEYRREPKLSCCPKCMGIALLEVTSDQGVFVFEPEPGKEKLKRKTVVDDGVNGRVKIDTSCSKPLEVGDVFGAYTVTDLIKIFDDDE